MTDTLDELHAQVVLTALRTNPNLTIAAVVKVYDGVVPNPTPDPPYVLVHTSLAWPRDGIGTALTAQQVTLTATFTVHCVGLNAAAARAVGMQVRSSLLNLKPVIAGRICGPVKQDDSQPPERDESTGRLVMDHVVIYSFTSTG